MFSLTTAPSGQAAATTARRRTTSPGREVIAASIRNSVGRQQHLAVAVAQRVRGRVELEPAHGRPAPGRPRRASASTRAMSSLTSNGLGR